MYRTSPVIIENEPLQGEQDTNAQRRCPVGANFPYNYLRSIHYPLHKCAAQPIEVMLILRLPPKGYANALPYRWWAWTFPLMVGWSQPVPTTGPLNSGSQSNTLHTHLSLPQIKKNIFYIFLSMYHFHLFPFLQIKKYKLKLEKSIYWIIKHYCICLDRVVIGKGKGRIKLGLG